jgi:hypothetical protein
VQGKPRREAVVFAIEDGFLCPPGHPHVGQPNASRFVFLPVAGIEHGPQFFRFRAVTDGDQAGVECFVLNAIGAADPTGIADREVLHLERAFPAATHALLLDARTGWARATLSPGMTGDQPELAAACVAAVRAGAGWDESDPIVVELPGATFAVSLEHAGTFWRATIRTSDPRG